MTTPAPPVTLTPGQFAKTGAAAKPGATYAKYQKFIAARRGGNTGTAAAPTDPYAPIIAGLPQPESQGQMQQTAQGEISPIVAAIVKEITQQEKGATGAISGYANDAASKLAAINYGQPYTQGEGAQAATDATLAAAEAGQGTSDAQSLQQRLAVINDPSVAAAATNVAGNGAANANADLSQGSASLSNLIANAAAANSYGQKLPGIQRAAGLQDIAGVQQTGAANIASGTTAAEQQLPSILQNLQSENDNRSSAIASAKQNQLARNDNIAAGTATLNEKTAATNATNQTRVDVANIAANERASTAQLAQARSDRTYRLQLAKTLGYDPVTGNLLPGYVQQGGRVVKASASAASKGTLTANEVSSLVQKWHDGKSTITSQEQPHTDANGNAVYRSVRGTADKVSYQQGYQYLRQHGQTDQQARTALNLVYGRGEQGRSWLTNDEQTALKSTGHQSTVGMYQGNAYLGPKQVAALKAAGKLPPGELVNGRYFIKPGN